MCKFSTLVLAILFLLTSPGAAISEDDIVWQNRQSGQVHYWPIKNFSRLGGIDVAASGPIDSAWQVTGVGDLDGNGTDDIIWDNAFETDHSGFHGQPHYWRMDKGARVEGKNIGTASLLKGRAVVVLGAEDMDANGTDEILIFDYGRGLEAWSVDGAQVSVLAEFRNTFFTNGGRTGGVQFITQYNGETLTYSFDPNCVLCGRHMWNFLSVGDFTGDRVGDILLGALVPPLQDRWKLAIWDGKQRRVSSIVANGAPDRSWKVVGAGDLNGDGHDEIVWKQSNGKLSYWQVRDGVVTLAADIGAAGPINDSEWQVVGVGNVDGQ